jgi:hypothetical protein
MPLVFVVYRNERSVYTSTYEGVPTSRYERDQLLGGAIVYCDVRLFPSPVVSRDRTSTAPDHRPSLGDLSCQRDLGLPALVLVGGIAEGGCFSGTPVETGARAASRGAGRV